MDKKKRVNRKFRYMVVRESQTLTILSVKTSRRRIVAMREAYAEIEPKAAFTVFKEELVK